MALMKFDIPTRARRCCAGEEDFQQGVHYISVLEEADKEGYQRKDYCVPCWEKLLQDPETDSFGKVHWKSQVPIRQKEDPSTLRRDELALRLLRETHQSDDQELISEAFVLALLLARSKQLQLKQEVVEDDGQSVCLYEVADTEEMLSVRKVDLSTLRAQELQASLAQKLNPPPQPEEPIAQTEGAQ